MMKEAKPFVMDPKVMSMHKELSVKSRVRGNFHARFCERVRVKHPRSTRPMTLLRYIKKFHSNMPLSERNLVHSRHCYYSCLSFRR